MSYRDNSDVGRNRSNRINHQLLTLRIQVGAGLIKQQDRTSIQQRTRNGQPLALPARKRSALLADISIESFGKICHNLLETHLTQHAHYVIIGRPGGTDRDVVPNRTGHHVSTLIHMTDEPSRLPDTPFIENSMLTMMRPPDGAS